MAGRVGQQLGNYRLVSLLGQGGFAEVYLGEHIYLETPAAIKVLYALLASEDVDYFRREARTIARLLHPHIVRVLEFGVEGATPFLVVDYAPNGTLRKRYPRGTTVPLPDIVSHVNQVADALTYAHEQKVIHRDVKPENMLVGRNHDILLSDFGIAVVAQSTRYQSTERTQDLAGTIAYMAPEQIQSRACPNSDQYSLAVVVYEWLCGARPFQGTFAEVAVKHTLALPPPLRERIPALSPAIAEVVMRALAKDPNQRFPSVRAFATALAQACQGEPASYTVLPDPEQSDLSLPADTLLLAPSEVIAPGEVIAPAAPPPVLDQLSQLSTTTLLPENAPSRSVEARDLKQVMPRTTTPLPEEAVRASGDDAALARQRHSKVSRRVLVAGLTGLAVAATGGASIILLESLQRSQKTTSANVSLGGVGTLLYTYRGHSSLLWSVAWSPDGKYIASASGDKTVQVWNATDGSHIYTYTGHTDTVYGVIWSPDSKRIASASYDKTVQVWDATNGFYPLAYSGHSSWVWAVAWSQRNNLIASAGGDKTVQVWDARDGTPLYTYHGHTGYVYSVAWSPDGTHIASASADRTVQIWNAGDGSNPYIYRPYAATMWAVMWSPDGLRIASAGDDKTVQLWDAANGDHRFVYYGHDDFVYAVAWSPDGKHIASAGDDKTVQIWNAQDGSNAYHYRGHAGPVRALAWSPDGKRIASASWDKTVQVWRTV